MSLATTRNVAIIVALAAIVDIVPGGGTAASVVIQVISLVFLAALVWVFSLMYREHRHALYSLGEARRLGLYAAAVVLTVTLTATQRLWNDPAGSVAWLVLVVGAIYAALAIFWSARRLS